jgi:hypothetical protein
MMQKIFYLIALFISMDSFAQYKGTGSVTQGPASATVTNLYSCSGGRVSGIGTIKATDNTNWTVPALVNFTNTAFPFSSDLNNACNGNNYANVAAALAALNGTDIVTVDADGEVITAYIFADNYFEMYINGTAVGKDKVPFTQFNSSIVRFKVKRPFTIAMLLVDWEENLGLGSELNGGFAYHPGDGGMVAVFKDASNKIIATTGNEWKAQTFYTSPITDLTCPSESGNLRLSTNCITQNSNDGSKYYGLHWSRPANWMNAGFDDSSWPSASTFTNATIGVDNKPAYTNFTGIFDDASDDAEFIWSSNVILDNEVIVRHTVVGAGSIFNNKLPDLKIRLYPNPAKNSFQIKGIEGLSNVKNFKIRIYNRLGENVYEADDYNEKIELPLIPSGVYLIKIMSNSVQVTQKLIIE